MSRPLLEQAYFLHHDGRQRRYLVRLPASKDDVPPPAVMVLHGAGGTALWTLAETRWADKADKAGFLLVLPEGLRRDPAQPPNFLDNPQVWNDGSPRLFPDDPEANDVGFLDAVLDDVQKGFPVDPRRVYVTGFSNGAGMVFRLAAERAGRFAAVAPVAGHCWLPDPRPQRPTPTLFLLGTDDPLFPLEGGEVVTPWGGRRVLRPSLADTLRRWTAAIGCPPEPDTVHEVDGVRVLAYCGRDGVEFTVQLIPGLGHHWPGGRGQFNPRIAGPPSDRVRANDVIWEFFRRHSLP